MLLSIFLLVFVHYCYQFAATTTATTFTTNNQLEQGSELKDNQMVMRRNGKHRTIFFFDLLHPSFLVYTHTNIHTKC